MSDMTLDREGMLALALRVEKAAGGDRELEWLIWAATAGPEGVRIEWNGEAARWQGKLLGRVIANEGWLGAPTQFLSSEDAAHSLLPDRFSWAAGDCNEDNVPWACVTMWDDPCTDFAATGASVAHARTAACLKALAQGDS